LLYLIPWMSLAAGWLLSVALGSNAAIWGSWFLLASAFLLGIPHGAEDFWILRKIARKTSLNLFLLAAYLLLILCAVAFWLSFPFACLTVFLLLSVWHFGSGDAVWETWRSGKIFFIASLGRGLIVLFAPLFFHPTESLAILSGLSENAKSIISIAPLLFLLGIFFSIISLVFKGKKSSLFILESLLLVIFFWIIPSPLFAITFYFVGVHSWRHFLRIHFHENQDLPSILSAKNNFWRFHLRVLPISLSSLVLMLVIWYRFASASASEVFLILLSALTLPHSIVVFCIERPKILHYFEGNLY